MNQLLSILQYLRRNKSLALGLGILVFLTLFTVVGLQFIDRKVDPYPLAAPASIPPTLSYCPRTEPDCPNPKAYPFGTDAQGRDLFAVAVTGTWMTLQIGFLAGGIGLVVGTFLGFTSAFYGGLYDAVIRLSVDVLLTVPGLLVLVVIASSLGDKNITVTGMGLIISLLAWRGPARVIRSQVLSMRERSYVMMARLNGMSNMAIIFKEMMPNLLPYLGASLVSAVTSAIFASMGLAALGLGPLREPTLGVTIYWVINQSAFLRGLWWWGAVPITIVALVFVMLFLISIGLDELANPRVRRAR
ncbi:ABC transporter permease [Litorilinea aerophila]|uniref:ABC transporter permease n=1 Tax=Litorilinea aerophila TaxID=1204385 RepID=UPI001B85CBE1|nr:ABC transporter permease [Litorilinea aerophila]MCC9076387.1 ABC transporter permease [Litorilinea aerophila]